MKVLIYILIIYISACSISLSQVSEVKLLPGDGSDEDLFGCSVSISGDYAIIGAFKDDDNGNESGSAYIFRRDGSNWTEEDKVTASDGAAGDYFGMFVSISGNYAIVGSPWDDDNGNESGSAYIYRRDGVNWIEEDKVTASDGAAGDYFGMFVSISGNYAIVGSPWDDDNGNESGSAYIIRRDGGNWIEEHKIIAGDGGVGDNFGYAVSIEGDYVIVGAYLDDNGGIDRGSAYIFRSDAGTWIEEKKITANDGADGDNFGGSVSLAGEYVIIGAFQDDDNGDNSGSAYIYKRSGSIWSEQQKLIASDAADNDLFGLAVAISGDYSIIGAPFNSDFGAGSGSSYIFRRNGTAWTEQHKITASDGAQGDTFGDAVALSGEYAIVSAEYSDNSGSNRGSAYIYYNFTTDVEVESMNAISFNLNQNYPNPFNPNTTINYQIPELSFVTLKVYDVLGNEIATLINNEKVAGSYEVEFDATVLPSGIYFYRLQAVPNGRQAGSFVETKKMMLVK
jgi:hypothetical protein